MEKINPSVVEVAPSSSVRPRKRKSRLERASDVRESIFRAAAKVIGERGYTDASINRITEAAGIAQGTFYLYFDSRQTLFDELLPHVGSEMLGFIRQRVNGAVDIYDMEERGFRAFFEFLEINPGFIRVLNEAETAAPEAHRKHFALLASHYVRALQRSHDRGEIRHYEPEDFEAIAYVFMAARSYLHLRYLKGNQEGTRLPENVVQAYMRLVRDGLK